MNALNSRNDMWKWLSLLIIAVFSIYVTFPVAEKLRFGLDLKGGTSFTLGVDEEKLRETIVASNPELTNQVGAVEAEINKTLNGCDARIIQVVRRRVDGMGMNEPVIQGMKGHRLLVQLPGVDEETRNAAKKSLQSAAFLEFRLTHPQNARRVSELLNKDICPEGYVKSQRGTGYDRAPNYAEVSSKPGYFTRLAAFQSPDPRYQFMLSRNSDNSYSPNFVSRKTELTGEALVSSSVERDMTGSVAISFSLNSAGAKTFSTLTRNYIAHGPKNPTDRGRELAIILDNNLISAPVLQSEIGAHGQITGHFTIAEAQQLSNDLNAGALPAPLHILAESSVAPTVGKDAINAGIIAAGLGFGLVALFMFVYYWFTGLVANVALFLDIALLPAALVFVANVLGVFAKDASMGGSGSLQLPVLTMPGIAGLVLTLGMAVDANVLIFERIREEFERNSSAGTAIKNGYGRAFTAILDSNLTTIMTGVVLFIVGTGPVRGYAITLTAGVIISMFTAVIVTRLLLDNFSDPNRTKPFKMLHVFKNVPNIDFCKLGKKTTWLGLILVLVTVGIFFFRAFTAPRSVLAVDLTGGTSIIYSVNQDKQPSEGELRKALNDFDNAAIIQYQRGVTDTTLLIKTGLTTEGSKIDVPAKVGEIITKACPDANFKQISADEIGSMVGADLKRSGAWAVGLSLCMILVYVAFRFEFGFGLGGVIALAHDALLTLGVFSLCGRQVSLIVVTALLTIVGYSINDKIVVFDRIREDLRHDPRTPFLELCNRAINSTLSRTVITSITTMFSVLALFAFGDGLIFDFALTMLLGIIFGTYSSMFIATPIMVAFYKGKRPDFEKETSSAE